MKIWRPPAIRSKIGLAILSQNLSGTRETFPRTTSALLADIRAAQAELGTRINARAGKLAAVANPSAPITNAAAFAKRLGNDVHLGEQRIIHRRRRSQYKKRMRMPSMLDPRLADIESWLAAEPRLTALAILGRLAERCPEQFGPPQHTVVQRLLRLIRRKAAEMIIQHPTDDVAPVGSPGTGGDAACDGHSARRPQPHRSSRHWRDFRPTVRRRDIRQAKVTSSDEAIRGSNLLPPYWSGPLEQTYRL